MFSWLRSKREKDAKSPPAAVNSRGLEVIEDDPETVWSMWEDAVAVQDSKFSASTLGDLSTPAKARTPTPAVAPDAADTTPLSLEDLRAFEQATKEPAQSRKQRLNEAMRVLELRHKRVASTVRTLWGHQECGLYLHRLISNGEDGVEFSQDLLQQDVTDALTVLYELHQARHGSKDA
ncbi:hypothetical protein [Rhodoferax aquaticus]|uniref:Uncharacterized protein n=1 Tax=Rhodoferax aquaticus TaxID=2527691 RepID=A0A515EU98_9BURK|nr:hypothetical protein [Rhodoferax aquaticus]QDL56231.1 hypothetical protein EXZ61_19845 [Rhodoferax aquaticus]